MKLYTDLDGTWITTKSGKDFPINEEDWMFIPNVLSSMVNFIKENNITEIVIVTNQAGIDEGYQKPLEVINKIRNIADNINAYFKLHSLKVDIKHNMAPALKSNNRKPFILAGYIPNFKSLKEATEALPKAMFLEDDTYYHFEDKKRYRVILDSPVGYMVGNASGIDKIEQIEPTDQIKKIARKTWGSRAISFIHRGKQYKISPVEESRANIVMFPDSVTLKDNPEPIYLGIFYVRKDHGDEDKKFAEINNLEYYDIEDFINKWS